MPFTTSESRRETDLNGPKVVGDRCFLHYRKMLRNIALKYGGVLSTPSKEKLWKLTAIKL